MQAVVIRRHGDPDVLETIELDPPQPGAGQALVRLKAAALNHLDIWVRRGWPGIRLAYPHTLGADGAGEIAALGESVSGWQVGDRVVINSNIGCGECSACLAGFDNRCKNWNLLGETIPGTYAEYVCVPARNLMALPPGFDEHTAAAAALVFHTAWHSLIVRGGLRPGESVMVVGASGGVNSACIQLAKFAGAKVYVVGSSPAKLELALALGADAVVDRTAFPNWSKEIFLLTDKQGVDVVVDNVGETFPHSLRAARTGGRILTVGNTAGPQVMIDNRYIFARHLSIIGSTMGTQADFRTVMDLVFAGKLKPAVDRTYPLAETRLAHQRLESGEQLGKITLAIP